ncbi:MAG: TROVE domain-containing protein, partial [Stackebrandtia sp.]
IPKPVKRGIADAVTRLYNERSLLKYDSRGTAFRFGDVIELVHPSPDPATPWQGDLFEHAINRRHNRGTLVPDTLPLLRARETLMDTDVFSRRELLARTDAGDRLAGAGMTWEALAGWLQGPLDSKAWESVIPSMGYMALLRNLRNFDEADVDDAVAASIAARLSDPERVATSRQLPMRFLSAYRSVSSLRWGQALEKTLEHSLSNVPRLPGDTLILVDTSGSMHSRFSADGSLMRWDAAAIFGLALANRCERAELVSFSNAWQGRPPSKVFPPRRGEALLAGLDRWMSDGYFIDGGTDTEGAVRRHYRGHNRVVILTDEQAHYHGEKDVTAAVPADRMVYTWNLAGYKHGHAPSGTGTRHTFGGLSDAAFRMIPFLEAGRNADWPWLNRT